MLSVRSKLSRCKSRSPSFALGGRSYYYFKSDRVGNNIFSMSNIKVYDGAYVSDIVTNAKDGDLLLHLDNFDLTDNITYTSDYDIDVTKSEWSNAEHDGTNSATVSGNVISHTRSKNNWYMQLFSCSHMLPIAVHKT